MVTTHSSERVVLVDETGMPCGTADKRSVHTSETPLHLAFSLYLFNDQGNVLATRRALTKGTWPGVWSNSCCGHPGPDEAVDSAVRRRAKQELGIDVEGLRLTLPDFRYRVMSPEGVVENEVCPVYTALVTGDVRADPAEVMDLQWVSWPAFVDVAINSPWLISPWAAEQAPLMTAVAHVPEVKSGSTDNA